jgi:L-amino acid N-acyltransferase YncA
MIQEEKLTKYLENEIYPLLVKHWHEIAFYKDLEVNVNWKGYYNLQDLNMLRIYTYREDDKLVGYIVYSVTNNLHYQQALQATQDVFYVESGKRGFMIGTKLLKFADIKLKEMGVHSIYQHVKTKHDFSVLLERLGYTFIEKIFTKRA